MQIEMMVTVKTYPLPSTKASIREHVCTAGVLNDGTMIRLYPIDYRYRSYSQWYHKYDIIKLDVEKSKHDPRPESYSPTANTVIRKIGSLDTKNNWQLRKVTVLARGVQTMCQLNSENQTNRSLGIIKPERITELSYIEADREWKPEWQALFKQELLFGPTQKPLEKIPFTFRYRHFCNSECNGHNMMIEDWEVGELYRNMRVKYGNEKTAADLVVKRFYDTMCAPNIDTHFFVGTILQHGTWVILGVFWPKKTMV